MKKIYTSPDVQEDRLGLDCMVLCFMAHIFINSDLLEGIEREISWVAPMGIRPPGVLAAWLVAGMTRFRPLLGECVDSTTASQTVGRTLPPARRHGDSDWAGER